MKQCQSQGQDPRTRCEAQTQFWRACPEPECEVGIVYCKAHGGDERAMREMAIHIKLGDHIKGGKVFMKPKP